MILSRQRVDPRTQRTHSGFTAREIDSIQRTFYVDPQNLWSVGSIRNDGRIIVGEQLWGEKLFDSSLKMKLP